MKNLKIMLMAVLTACLASCLGDNTTDNPASRVKFELVDFDKVKLPTSGKYAGVMIGQSYESENGYVFQNYYDGSQNYNAGYTVSNHNDTDTPGYENQYSVYSSSSVKDNQFLIYNPPYGSKAFIQRKDGKAFYPYHIDIAPTTYTMLSILKGDDFAKKFEKNDSLNIKVTGCDANGEPIKGSVFSFNFVKNLSLYQYDSYYGIYGWLDFSYVKPTSSLWLRLPLYALGKVNKILIEFDSSDKGEFGINTPQYLALDNFWTVSQETVVDYEKSLNQNK